MNRLIQLTFLFLCLSVTSMAHGQFASKYKISLLFEQTGYKEGKKELLYKWNRTVGFREDFHLFLDEAPLKAGYGMGVIAGVVYPKNGALHCTLSLSAAEDLKDESGKFYRIGETRFFKVPKSMTFELPLADGSGFQRCTVTIKPVGG